MCALVSNIYIYIYTCIFIYLLVHPIYLYIYLMGNKYISYILVQKSTYQYIYIYVYMHWLLSCLISRIHHQACSAPFQSSYGAEREEDRWFGHAGWPLWSAAGNMYFPLFDCITKLTCVATFIYAAAAMPCVQRRQFEKHACVSAALGGYRLSVWRPCIFRSGTIWRLSGRKQMWPLSGCHFLPDPCDSAAGALGKLGHQQRACEVRLQLGLWRR